MMLHLKNNKNEIVTITIPGDWVADPWIPRALTFADLQKAQLAWVQHNFPQQLGKVSVVTVQEVCNEIRPGGMLGSAAHMVANALNAGDPRLVKRPYHGLLGAVEELGELAHAFLKMEQGIRGCADVGKAKAEMVDAIADCIIFLASFCNTMGIDLQDAVETTWAEVSKRDWVKWPETGRPPDRKAEWTMETRTWK